MDNFYNKLTKEEISLLRKQAINFFKNEVKRNVWRYDYSLCKLTSWGFYLDAGGQEMISCDEKVLDKVVRELLKFLPHAPNWFYFELDEIFRFAELED